jgi:acyl-CoA thioesterase-1
VVVAMGDSLTAGLGVGEKEAYPARLEDLLREASRPWRVVNAGISGETSSGARSRVEWVLRLSPRVVILETGANDGLRGISPALTRENIEAIVRRFQAAGVRVILAGMEAPPNMGGEYTRAFREIYPQLASRHGLPLIPFFLDQVAGEPSLNQANGIHPTAQGYRIIARAILPVVMAVLDEFPPGP